MLSQPHQKQKGGCQVHWEDRAYVVLIFIVSNIVFPNEQSVGAEMLTETWLSGQGFARIGKTLPYCVQCGSH
jgi:hypothetical protein